MGMSAYYTGAGVDDAESIRTIHRALDLGITLIDTAEVYGPYTNEELVGRAIAGRRDEVVLATKFGVISHRHGDAAEYDSSPQNIRTALEGSLSRLGTDHIDLYHQDRVDPATPIPGTKRVLRLEENAAADTIALTAGQLARLTAIPPPVGDRRPNMTPVDRQAPVSG
jgi:aryl-alcohol dehydrogenase-like predicted oxidoreductase